MTLTLRNDNNDYAVKDVEIVCAFRGAMAVISPKPRSCGTVGMKSRKTFARIPVGFVNVNADRAKCSLWQPRRT